MSIDTNPNPSTAGLPGPRVKPKAEPVKLSKLPGLIVISFYMLMVSAMTIIAVASGRTQPFLLVFPVLFIAGAIGLLLLLRWAWALTLAAVALMAGLSLWEYTTQHTRPPLVWGLLNLVIFLYLVRSDVRKKLH
ncbi:MAG: DUF2127 domain-containing protein [Terracidiphilus sp.]|jgi:uncharacterized membrane protein (DUF2068 family)